MNSNFGCSQVERAIKYCKFKKSALDVGCRSGGRIIYLLLQQGFEVTGVDISKEMLVIAQKTHPEVNFYHEDICSFRSGKKYDLIVAWDSLFHLPVQKHQAVLKNLCSMLNHHGILLFTFGDDHGEHESIWN
ncbi:hypothetical protein BH23BAC1_BH23BAC1_13370 [soil metagenome]